MFIHCQRWSVAAVEFISIRCISVPLSPHPVIPLVDTGIAPNHILLTTFILSSVRSAFGTGEEVSPVGPL